MTDSDAISVTHLRMRASRSRAKHRLNDVTQWRRTTHARQAQWNVKGL